MIKAIPGVYQEWLPKQKRTRNGTGTRMRLNLEAVIVVSYAPRPESKLSHTDVISCAWRHVHDTTRWTIAQGFHSSRNLRPHPEADRVWAEYCAAVLVNEGETK